MEIVYVFFDQNDKEIDRISFHDRKFLPEKYDLVTIGTYEGYVIGRHFNYVSSEIIINIELK